MSTLLPDPSTLGPAHAAVVRGVEALAVWHGPADTSGRVRAGHDAITAIDTALRALYDARAALVTEIFADNVERAARVDELLAQVKAERFGHPNGYDYRREVEDQGADDVPVRPGIEGWSVNGRGAR